MIGEINYQFNYYFNIYHCNKYCFQRKKKHKSKEDYRHFFNIKIKIIIKNKKLF